MAQKLGIYEDRNQLDHDVAMLLDGLVRELVGRDVEPEDAWRAVRRVARESAGALR